ncbi:MAG: TIGR01777 family oxidoreductase [Myxococcota bacterium]
MARFQRRVRVPVPAEALFDWHVNDGAFERLTPPWEHVQVTHRTGPLREGMRATMRVGVLGPLAPPWLGPKWVAEHVDVDPPRGFIDRQVEGPFSKWEHQHRIDADGDDAAWLHDDIEFEPPLPPLGRVGTPIVRAKLERMFDYRHAITVGDLAAQRHLRSQAGGGRRTLAISGASGLLGSALVPYLTTAGHDVRRLVRRPPERDDEIHFDPATGHLDGAALAGVDAVIHLAGENVGDGRWRADKKRRILESRVEGTRLLADALAAHGDGATLVSASGVGYYGHRGDELLSEESGPGAGFLAEVCRVWEDAATSAARAGVRVVVARIGVVLTPDGGALEKLRLPFSLGLGGRIGSGDTWMSWIGHQDAVRALALLALDRSVAGAVNVVAPHPVQNRTFVRKLAAVLRRPALVPLPQGAAELMLGHERARELLFTSTRAHPGRLLDLGFPFQHLDLEPALRHGLGRRAPSR